MSHKIDLPLVQSVVDTQKDLIVIFHNGQEILMNKAFKKFVGSVSIQEYKKDFGSFVNNFVPHPSYFNANDIQDGESWFDAILRKPKLEQVVSMMNSSHEPHAFAVAIDTNTPEYIIVNFNDITQSLIKRIMIENERSIDKDSGAYTKDYFLQVAKSYQEAALFNEKIVGVISIKVRDDDASILVKLVASLKKITRQDDMVVRWGNGDFLIVFLVDNELNATVMLKKVEVMMQKEKEDSSWFDIYLSTQKDAQSINSVVKRVIS